MANAAKVVDKLALQLAEALKQNAILMVDLDELRATSVPFEIVNKPEGE